MLDKVWIVCLLLPLSMARQHNCTMGIMSDAINSFSIAYLQQQLGNHSDDNLLFSPVSLSMALTMLDLGAKGNTSTQINNVLRLGDLKTSINESNTEEGQGLEASLAADRFQMILSDLKNQTSGSRLDVVNAMLVQKDYPILGDYRDKLEKKFMARAEDVDFKTPEALTAVNEWASNATEGKIKQLVEHIDTDTRLILGSAVYFKGKWASFFDKDKTVNSTFHNINGSKTSAPMMFKEATFKVNIDEKTKTRIVELPYSGEKTSMVLISPEENATLADFERDLTVENLTKMLGEMANFKVRLTMPRFQLATSMDAKDTLINMGMVDAFGKKSDLSGITKVEGLTVSSVSQKAVIEVNEEGTEASAATEVTSLGRSLPRVLDVKLDHPFLFLIKHHPTNVTLFLGRVVKF